MTLLVRTQKEVRSGRENQYYHRGHLNRHVQTIDRSRNIKAGAGEKSEGNEEHDIDSGRKGILVIQ